MTKTYRVHVAVTYVEVYEVSTSDPGLTRDRDFVSRFGELVSADRIDFQIEFQESLGG